MLLVDTNRRNIAEARMQGLAAFQGSILEERTMEKLDLDGIGRMLALTPNEDANALAALHCSESFGRGQVYQLASGDEDPRKEHPLQPVHLHGRILFGEGATYEKLGMRFAEGAKVKTTRITAEFTCDDYTRQHGESALPLFVVEADGRLAALTADTPAPPREGTRIIGLVDPGA